MADKLVVLTFLLLFIGFRPTISDGVLNQEATGDVPVNNDLSPAFKPGSYFHNSVENSVSKDKSVKETQERQHVEEEPTADVNSKDSEDQAPSAETVESKGSPGFFSQVFSELTAPFNEVDEQEFLSEDSDSENPSLDDQTGDDDDPEDKNDETSNDEGDKPDFATLPFAKSVTEDVNSARTADQQLPVEGDSESGANQELGQDSTIKSANGDDASIEETIMEEKKTGIELENDESEDHGEDKPRSVVTSVEKDLNKKELKKLESDASELSDEDLEHLRVKSKLPKEEDASDALKEEDLVEKREEELVEEEKQELEEQDRKVLLEKERKVAEEEKRRKEELEKQELEETK
ncbi:hypothetical protein OS493_020223 [Desmophyllum pertusum]|uniref:Uncharacterized protein n=1 Tax=Desmophyllum pertusum TaxID=174260 RepID=A0A9X0D4K6_9CNID|nr:hypothetical protein OS493_020223 [Desmophyllum pertusum]